MSEAGAEGLVEELRERTALKFMGDCKCGRCQLVPRELVDRAAAALEAQGRALAEAGAEIERLRKERDHWKFGHDASERQRDEALEALIECEEYFDNRADADCDQDGFAPNKEMHLLSSVRGALEKIGSGRTLADANSKESLSQDQEIAGLREEVRRTRGVLAKAKAFHDRDSGCNGFTADYECLRWEINDLLGVLPRGK